MTLGVSRRFETTQCSQSLGKSSPSDILSLSMVSGFRRYVKCDLRSSVMLLTADWWLVTDVPGRPVANVLNSHQRCCEEFLTSPCTFLSDNSPTHLAHACTDGFINRRRGISFALIISLGVI